MIVFGATFVIAFRRLHEGYYDAPDTEHFAHRCTVLGQVGQLSACAWDVFSASVDERNYHSI